MQFNVCGLLVLLIQKSGPFCLSLWSLCLSLYTMLPSLRLSLTGRRSGGVWGKCRRPCTPTRFLLTLLIVLFPYLLYFLTLLHFGTLLFNPLGSSRISVGKPTSSVTLWGFCFWGHDPWELWDGWGIFWGTVGQTYFWAFRKILF